MNVDSYEGDVLHRARDGDERAFQALFRAAQPGLLRYLAVIVGDSADEIATQTWIEVGRDLAAFPGNLDDFRTWVASIGRRRAVEHVEALHGVGRMPRQGAGEQDAYAGVPPRTAGALRLIADLEPSQAEAILLRSVVGLDERAAAAVMGVRRSVLRRAAVRGLRALSRRLDAAPADRPPAPADRPPAPADRSPAPADRSPGRRASAAPTLRVVTLPPDPAAPRPGGPDRSAPRVLDRGIGVQYDLTPSCGIEVTS